VCTPAYFSAEYRSPFVSENSSCRYGPEDAEPEWTDDEIAAIRVVLQRLTAGRVMNANDAEDLVQETLLTMITKYPGCRLEKGPLVWSMGILRNKVGNYYRRIRRYSPLGEQASDAPRQRHPSPAASSPEWKVFHRELQGIIAETLARLPSSQRQAMELLLAGLEAGEIAKQLSHESYQNVMNRLHRGRKKLARELAKYGYGPDAKYGLRKMKRCRANRRSSPAASLCCK
jgi:RNA polymerase sigma factor (sigma-70 family)